MPDGEYGFHLKRQQDACLKQKWPWESREALKKLLDIHLGLTLPEMGVSTGREGGAMAKADRGSWRLVSNPGRQRQEDQVWHLPRLSSYVWMWVCHVWMGRSTGVLLFHHVGFGDQPYFLGLESF